jgi:hypothetical protein
MVSLGRNGRHYGSLERNAYRCGELPIPWNTDADNLDPLPQLARNTTGVLPIRSDDRAHRQRIINA